MLWFTVALSLFTGILFGLIPAIQGSRLDLVSAIKSQPDTPTRGGRWTLGLDLRGVLVTGQIAVSLVALIGAGLFLRSFQEALRLNPGFRTEGLAVMYVNAGAQGYAPQRGMQFYREAVERVRQLPGVQSASWGEADSAVQRPGRVAPPVPRGSRAVRRNCAACLCRSTAFGPATLPPWASRSSKAATSPTPIAKATELVAIVNETTARMYLARRGCRSARRSSVASSPKPLHRRRRGAGRASTVALPPRREPHLYFAGRFSTYMPAMALAVRTSGDPQAVLPAGASGDSGIGRDHADAARRSRWPKCFAAACGTRRLGAMLLAVFGLLALTLTTRRRVRRHGLFRHAAHARDRHPHGARRGTCRGVADGVAPRL